MTVLKETTPADLCRIGAWRGRAATACNSVKRCDVTCSIPSMARNLRLRFVLRVVTESPRNKAPPQPPTSPDYAVKEDAMKSHTPASTTSNDGTRPPRPGRALLCLLGVTLTGLASAFLLSPWSPVIPSASTVSLAPPVHLEMPATPRRQPERFERLAQQARPASNRASQTASATTETRRAGRPEVGMQPAADQPEFVPTPPAPGAGPLVAPAQPPPEPVSPARG